MENHMKQGRCRHAGKLFILLLIVEYGWMALRTNLEREKLIICICPWQIDVYDDDEDEDEDEGLVL